MFNNNKPSNLKDGGLKDELLTGDRKGTGVFGKELNKGTLAVISDDVMYAKDDMFIEEAYRRRGIGAWALKTIFKHESLRVRVIPSFNSPFFHDLVM